MNVTINKTINPSLPQYFVPVFFCPVNKEVVSQAPAQALGTKVRNQNMQKGPSGRVDVRGFLYLAEKESC